MSSKSHLALGVLALTAALVISKGLSADTFPVDVSHPKFTLYTDPNSGVEVKMGGFSGLVPAWGSRNGRLFHVITDRGPNVDVAPGGKGFVVPSFSPSILTVLLRHDGTGQILKVLPLKKLNGAPLSGIASACNTSEDPMIDLNGNPLVRDPDGFDVEGLTSGPFGTFWICEEYLPSVSLVAPDGRVVLRLAPQGSLCGDETIPTYDVLPAVLRKRIANRGFEGVSLTANGRLCAVLQRPLANPDRATSEASRSIRLVEIELLSLLRGRSGAVRQLLYLTEGKAHRSTYASDLYSINPDVLLVTERRTDKVFTVRISTATDITGLEDASGNLLVPFQPDPMVPAKTTIEQLTEAELAAIGISPLKKALVYSDLKAIDPLLDKVEGVTAVGNTIVVCHDNDFDLLGGDFTTVPATLIFQSPPNLPKIYTIPLASIPVP